jgi:hypothetical protein
LSLWVIATRYCALRDIDYNGFGCGIDYNRFGFQNYVRPHGGFEGKTPSEVCGISIDGKNKWLTLMQNANKDREEELVEKVSEDEAKECSE